MRTNLFLWLAMGCVPAATFGQTVERLGKGSYASFPPAYKSKTDSHEGFNAGFMMTRNIFCDETDGRPIPTNDWWTDIINNRYSGALWSYPAMLHTGDYGVRVSYPSYWADEGKEIKSRSSLSVSAVGFNPEATIATDWHDLDVTFRMPDRKNAEAAMRVTAAHGIPFTWFEFDGLTPMVTPSDTHVVFRENSSKGIYGVRIGDDLYGIYYPKGCEIAERSGALTFPGGNWIVVALLTEEDDLERFAEYAPGVVRDSRVGWRYDQAAGAVATDWEITTENLRNPSEGTPVMLGLLPHVYKYSSRLPQQMSRLAYMTPRGEMRMYADVSGRFSFEYPFSGMMPYYAAPSEDAENADGFRKEVMETLMRSYAEGGGFGADTYWGGKGLVQMALNMTFAKECGNEELYLTSRKKLRDAFENWLTYTPGEDSGFFSYYPRWGSMLGFNVSYDSDAFNDHHFHYGYFTYAAALLCMEDAEFAADYGELLTLIAKDYANYDREDGRFPFMRTLDPWCGHSWAGGLGDAGNDNGNGQESTSEAMQSWGGMYLLGVALGDDKMRDAGIWGWSTEARATREYWFDVDAPRPANEGGRKPWAGKGDRLGNYDYSQYKYAYNSNITGKGIGWWTWFGGDPLFMHGIQWMPVSPALDYLSWDNDFVDWAYDDMMSGANSTFSHEWFTPTYNTDNGDEIQPLADNDWGNVTLAYMQRSRPAEAASIFNRAYKEGRHIATAVSTGHISYYLIHHHLTYGDIDNSIVADLPTASAYLKDGVYTYMVYNPYDEERTVNFRRSGATVRSVTAPPRRLTAFTAPAVATSVEMTASDGLIIPPGESGSVIARVLDQYGATVANPSAIVYSVDKAGVTVSDKGGVSVGANVAKGSTFVVRANSADLTAELTFTVNDRPVVSGYHISNLPQYIEINQRVEPILTASDQYGAEVAPEVAKWRVEGAEDNLTFTTGFTPETPGRYTLSALDAAGNAIYSQTLVVVPMLPDVSGEAVALSSSEENVGSKTEYVNDGDRGSRWGSAHTANEWIILDFGREMYLTSATPDWEAAYGADSDFEVAHDGATLVDFTGNYAGTQKTIRVPAEEEWTVAAEVRGNSHAGEVATRLDKKGRYLRLRGKVRGSAYGYSIHEMAVRGIAADVADNEVVGIDFGLPEVADEGKTITLNPVAYTLSGDSGKVNVEWTADKEAEFKGNDFCPLSYGVYNLTARTADGLKAEGSLFVNEGIRAASMVLSPAVAEGITGEEISLTLSALNQFGGEYPLDDMPTEIVIIDKTSGRPVADGTTTYDLTTATFRSDVKGNFTVSVNGGMATAEVTVKDISEANLALRKAVTASASTGGNDAASINDGDMQTRWESPAKDGQWVEIDLGQPFVINRTVLNWEGAFAEVYSLSVSMDGENWWKVYDCSNGKGGQESISLPQIPARAMRLDCVRRGTVWGNSLYEWEIYGRSRFDTDDDGQAPVISEFISTPGNGNVSVALDAVDASGYVFVRFELCDANTSKVLATHTSVIKSGETARCEFDDLGHGGRYFVRGVAEDPFGNSTDDTVAFESALDLTGINIALNKQAEATTSENQGIGARYAVDGDYATRWGSEFNDNESLTVDLGDVYSLVEIRLFWDATAYATDYIVEGSEDGKEFTPIFSRSSWTAPTDINDCRRDLYDIPVKTYARYVRLTGQRRATQYGTSLRELEVYADNDFDRLTGIEAIDTDSDADIRIYNLQGLPVDQNPADLPAGFYIIGGKKVMINGGGR